MPQARSRLENRPLSRRMHKEKCRPLVRLASGAPVFANGAVTAAMSYAFASARSRAVARNQDGISGSQGRASRAPSNEAPLSSGVIGRMAGDGHGPPAPFASMDEAAIAGIQAAVSHSTEFEYGGAIVQVGSGYFATHPVTIGSRFHFAFSLDAGVRPSAIYHTHPGGSDYGVFFSPADIYTARDHLGVPSYIGVIGDRSVRVFDPNTMRATFQGRGLHQRSITRGQEVCARCF